MTRTNWTRRLAAVASVLVLPMTGSIVAAEAPYLGTWKLNVTNSDLVGHESTTIIVPVSSGGYQFTDETGQSYTFKMDGREYTDPYSTKVSWKQLDDRSWEATNKVNGKFAGTDTAGISPDGKTLTIVSRAVQTNGKTIDQTQTLQRVGSGLGLTGTWKAIRLTIEPYMFTFKSVAGDAFDLTMGDLYVCTGCTFGGMPCAITGPLAAAGTTATFKMTTPRSFEMTWHWQGKAIFDAAFTISGDGKTLTEVGGAPGGPSRTWVFQRQ